MTFTRAVVQIVRDNADELTTVEIRDFLEAGYPQFYGTPSHLRNVENGNYPSVSVAVIAQINCVVRQSSQLEADNTVRPKIVYYIDSIENEVDQPIFSDYIESVVETEKSVDNDEAEIPVVNSNQFTLLWHLCDTYDAAKDFFRIIYLHERSDKAFYLGIARNSFFGGHKRTVGKNSASARYNSGYRHWIEGCLLSAGTKLYIAEIVSGDTTRLAEVENYLINTVDPEMNRRHLEVIRDLTITHTGHVPMCITGQHFPTSSQVA